MYVCVCQAVTERQVREAIADGIHSIHGLRKHLGVTAMCGKCASCARNLLNEQRAGANPQGVGACGAFCPPSP